MTHRHKWYTVSGTLSRLLFQVSIMAPDASFLPYAIACAMIDYLGIVKVVYILSEAWQGRKTFAQTFAQIIEERNKRKGVSNDKQRRVSSPATGQRGSNSTSQAN